MVRTRLLLALATLALVWGSGAHANDGMSVFPDPSRIASIGGAVTEIVYALGEEKRLVARDSTSLYPQAALTLPDVGYMRALSPEGVLSVDPTGLLVVAGSGPKEALDVLKKASVAYISVPDAYDHQGILDKIKVIGTALGADAKAAELAASVDADLTAAQALTAGVTTRKRVLFILSMQGGKILGAGDATAASGIITMAGAKNALAGISGYKPLSDESVLTANPDVILMMDRGGDHSIADAELFAHPAIATTEAGKAKALVRMDGGYLLGFGPRTAGAVRDLATALYGDQIKD